MAVARQHHLRIPKIDSWLVIASVLLLFGGFLALYSAGTVREGGIFSRHLFNFALGLVPFSIFFFTNPEFWRRSAWVLYVVSLAFLELTRRAGNTAGGAQRWLDIGPIQFQPSELAKLFAILTLASFFASRQDSIKKGSTFALSLFHIAVPAALIFIQPHLGATLVLLVIWLSVSLGAGVPVRFILLSALAAVMAVGIAFSVPGVMRDYQKSRVIGLFLGSSDEQGTGFQTSRAQIAFGTGGVSGAGFLQGEQKRGRFIPEQHTDFIFTVVGEEGGLVGGTLVLLAFGLFFYRVWLVMLDAAEPYHRMLAAGVYGLLAFHTFVNIGMLVGLVPVVGLWLPFYSYGGTALWLCMACVGLLLNIRGRARPVLF